MDTETIALATGQFQGAPSTTVVEPNVEGVKAFFHLPDWPEGRAT